MNNINMTGDTLPGQLGIMEASRSTMIYARPIMEGSETPDDVKELVIRLVEGLNGNTTMDDDTQGRNELRDAATKLHGVIVAALKNLEGRIIFSDEDKNTLYDGTQDFFRDLRAKAAETQAKLRALEGIIRNNTSDLFITSDKIKGTDAALILQNPEFILNTMNDYLNLVDAISNFRFESNRESDIVEEGTDLIVARAEALIEELTNKEEEA